MTPERKAEIEARLEAIIGPMPRPKPKVISRDDVGVIRDADVHVSRADPNATGEAEVVSVRRDDFVTVNMAGYERQQTERARDRTFRRNLDPFNIGLYGPIDEHD